MSPRLAVLVAILWFGLADRASAECAQDGHALHAATEELAPKTIERTARKVLGPSVARIVRDAPWSDLWRGHWLSSSQYFFEAFETKLKLPRLKLPIAAPPPFTISVELAIDVERARCIDIDVSDETTADDGSVTVKAPMAVTLTIAVAGLTERVSLQTSEAQLIWQRNDKRLAAWLLVAELELGLSVPDGSGADMTMDTIRGRRELGGAKDLLVRSLNRAGSHRAAAVALLSEIGFQGLPGDSWVRLRQLQAKNKLRAAEQNRLDWLARRPVFVSGDDVAMLTAQATSTPPRIFVAGQEVTSWTLHGDRFELPVGVTGLAAVRVEFADGSSEAFVTVLDRDVRIRVMNVWGASLEAPPAGVRCGVLHGEQVDDLRTRGLVGGGSVVDFGVPLIPSLPGRYTYEPWGLSFERDATCE